MRLDLLRRIERLEKSYGENVVAFIDAGTDPQTGEVLPVAGWEVVAVTRPWPEPVIGRVSRELGESDDALADRARAIGARHGGVVACFPLEVSPCAAS